MAEITGKTRIFGIIADPIGHVKTPEGLNMLMRKRGVDGVLVPLHVRPQNLESVIAGLRHLENFGGFIATVPHKSAILHLCDDVSERARRIGAANAVRREADGRLVADMLDGEGFIRGLREHGIEPRGQATYLAGAGGAANAIAFALAEAGVSRLTVANRTRAKAEELRVRLLQAYPQLEVGIGTPDPSGHDLVINGTSLGLRPEDPLPLDETKLSSAMIVAEIIMQPENTALLKAATTRGCRLHFGMPMLVGQLELMGDFLGMHPVGS